MPLAWLFASISYLYLSRLVRLTMERAPFDYKYRYGHTGFHKIFSITSYGDPSLEDFFSFGDS